jgi:hypothetical protein
MSEVRSAEQLHPTNPFVRDTTVGVLERAGDAQEFLDKVTSSAVPAPLMAQAWVALVIGGTLKVGKLGDPWSSWNYDSTIWGGPGCVGTAPGFMYTAYSSWDGFFRNVTSCHVQGISAGGGLLQINWFIANGTPVGQFNGVLGGIAAFEAGGAGKWTKS